MKIGYWLGEASLEGGGTTPYAWRVLEILLEQSQLYNFEVIILCSDKVQEACEQVIKKYNAKSNIAIIPHSFKKKLLPTRLINKIRLKFNLVRPESLDPWFQWFNKLNIDLLHIPYQNTPYYQLNYPFVVTMHDVQELHYPEFFTPEERAIRAEYNWKSLEQSRAVVVSFSHVKNDLIKYFRLPSEKIKVCPPPYAKIELSLPNHQETIIYHKKYHDWQDFLLYPAQTWEHKNHLSLIKALELIYKQTGKTLHLVCTGRKNPGFFPTIENYLKTSPMFHFIHFMDIVPEGELCWLYQNCALVVIPTLYEAGSFPLLEAMSLQAPVICSSITSLPETIGDKQFVFDPLNVEQMASLILKMLDNQELRSINIKNNQKQIEELRKIDTSKYFIELWQSIVNL